MSQQLRDPAVTRIEGTGFINELDRQMAVVAEMLIDVADERDLIAALIDDERNLIEGAEVD